MAAACSIHARVPVPADTPTHENASTNAARRADEWARGVSSRLARGDRTALAEVYEAWFDRWLASARAMSRQDEAFCLDVVQDATLRLARGMRVMSSAPELDAWMHRVIRSATIDALRRETRRLRRECEAVRRLPRGVERGQGSEIATVGTPEVHEAMDWINAELDRLAPAERAMVERHLACSVSLARLAQEQARTRDAVHGTIRRIVDRLRHRASEVFHD